MGELSSYVSVGPPQEPSGEKVKSIAFGGHSLSGSNATPGVLRYSCRAILV